MRRRLIFACLSMTAILAAGVIAGPASPVTVKAAAVAGPGDDTCC